MATALHECATARTTVTILPECIPEQAEERIVIDLTTPGTEVLLQFTKGHRDQVMILTVRHPEEAVLLPVQDLYEARAVAAEVLDLPREVLPAEHPEVVVEDGNI